MTAMDEPSLTGIDALGKADSLCQRLVRVMWLFSQSIDNQRATPFDVWNLSRIDSLHIRDISQTTDTIAHDRQVVMHHFERHDIQVANTESLMLMDLMQLDSWHTRIAMFCKTVGQHLKHPLSGQRISIHIDFAKLAIRAYVVHPAHVVIMGMSNEDTIYLTERLIHDLLAEVGSAVYQQSCRFRLYQY